MKLSKAQEKILIDAKQTIDTARKYNTYDEYFINEEASRCNSSYNTPEKYKEKAIKDWNENMKYWEEHKNAIVLVTCNEKSILKLQEYGLIEIIHKGTTNSAYYPDKIKILNY